MTELAQRLIATPAAFTAELADWLPTAPPDELMATRHQLVDVAAYVKRYSPAGYVEALRSARLTEWTMARRWPVNARGVYRDDGRPDLHASKSADEVAWQRVYQVGRVALDRLLSEPDAENLTQAAVIRWAVGAHVSNNSGQNEWYTPPAIIEAARNVLGHIALDPASSAVAQLTVRATTHYTAEDDGLSREWFGPIWLNPPYAQPLIGQFIAKLCDTDAEAIALVNNGTETEWGQRLIRRAAAVCFPAGRIKFLDPEGNPGGAPLQGQMIAYIGSEPARFRETFSAFGPVLVGAS